MAIKGKSAEPIALLNRKPVCRNARFDVYLDEIRSEHGETVCDYLVVAPRVRTTDGITGIAVLPIIDDRIGLLHIYRHSIRALSWEIPRGFVDSGESAVSSARRELEEETGLRCAADNIVSYGLVTPEPGVLAATVHLYVALHCVPRVEYRASEIGHKQFLLFTPNEVKAMIAASEIRDPCTLISCLKYLSGI